MARGRARKSVEQRKLEGTFRIDRHGGNNIEPIGEPVKPKNLKGSASDLWDEITPELVRLGIATSVDSSSLATLCEWWREYRDAADSRDEQEKGLAKVATSISALATAIETAGNHETAKKALQVLSDLRDIIGDAAALNKSRVQRMKAAYAEFSRIAARFGLTPMDRRAMRDVDPSNKGDDPITKFLKSRENLVS